jgi:hypothetical protein
MCLGILDNQSTPWIDVQKGSKGRKNDTDNRGEQPVVRQKLKSRRFNVRFQLVKFNSVTIVNEDIFFLRNRVHRMIM